MHATLPVDVLALGYDVPAARLLVLDETKERLGALPIVYKKGHLRLIDTHAGTSEELLSWPRLSLFDRLGLAARQDGSYVLVASRESPALWTAWRFKLNSAGHVVITGQASGSGQLISDPIHTSGGVVLMLKMPSQNKQIVLTDTCFFPTSLGWGSL